MNMAPKLSAKLQLGTTRQFVQTPVSLFHKKLRRKREQEREREKGRERG